MEGHDEEIKLNGKTKLLTKGKAKLAVNAYVEPDFTGKKASGSFGNFLDKIYNKYIGKDELGKCIGSAAGDISEMLSRFKQSVNSTLK